MEMQDWTLASRGKRFRGVLIDTLIAMLTTLPLMWALGMFETLMAGQPLGTLQTAKFFLLGWTMFLLIHGRLLYTRGQTVGKYVVDTRIADLEGNVPGFGKLILLRYVAFGLFSQIPFVGWLVGLVNVLFIFREDRRCLHDHLAGTRVVEA
jgi:uncharacterized RDD family membrane protein YckC